MIIYSATKTDFIRHTDSNQIEDHIQTELYNRAKIRVAPSELRSWKNSLSQMANVIRTDDIHPEARVGLEYKLPNSSKRVDFILAGATPTRKTCAVIVELKQWESATKTHEDGIVETFLNGNIRRTIHPSYQAWSYQSFLESFNTAVHSNTVQIKSCAFLHNCTESHGLMDDHYDRYLSVSPLFLRRDVDSLRNYLSSNVIGPSHIDPLALLDRADIRPSQSIIDSVATVLKGSPEFTLIDEQKVAYELAVSAMQTATKQKRKHVILIQGGPGTGKSVVAIHLLAEALRLGLNSLYISKNSAPREVMKIKLQNAKASVATRNLFSGSGRFMESKENEYGALIVDEAHRLTLKSGMYGNLGENQIAEIIKAANCSIFFIDDRQRVTLADAGSTHDIRRHAMKAGAIITETELPSQFRCSGSDGYLSWLDHSLQIEETANPILQKADYRLKVCDSVAELVSQIRTLDEGRGQARLVAGYCWKWISKKDRDAYDFEFGGNLRFKWNLEVHGSAWLTRNRDTNEIGCIHTVQGLELPYIGVIIGPDLLVRDGKVITDAAKRAPGDKSVKGYKKRFKEDPATARSVADSIIKNTYRTLMTRGTRGCFVYSEDEETRTYFRSLIAE